MLYEGRSVSFANLGVCLLHEEMLDKQGKEVTTSLTLIDLHDISRCAKTYGLGRAYIAHPASAIQKLAGLLTNHWQTGYGSRYNPDRKAAIDNLSVVSHLEDAVSDFAARIGKPVKLIATSAKAAEDRLSFEEARSLLKQSETGYLLLFGTGWGMSEALMSKTDYVLAPVSSPTGYNHLSVRTACAIILDRLCG